MTARTSIKKERLAELETKEALLNEMLEKLTKLGDDPEAIVNFTNKSANIDITINLSNGTVTNWT